MLSLSLRVRVSHPNTCTSVRLLGPCFKTGQLEHVRQTAIPGLAQSAAKETLQKQPRTSQARNDATSHTREPKQANNKSPDDAGRALLIPKRSTEMQRSLQSIPPQQFQVLLTLFSKFFSSFPHGTSSLSVSHQYLAL
ncbi:hypothetical protein BEWA_052190 [Theileria equi strain WA]|uniref:Uncharacterized protein n=1 Tax=Theileria equi strain WA TaxID=1537102 RepID=L1LD36_THEEQ|nr:hypothetical protein BEWA_052190 [Theileria equi strain WA]EKX73165.1 hypothetical protein BEWA_052190 [Theileria equi strain WA]|eukprot:XP_004832617.1 hypothetical protein BEWA_052190 [Theileria equi strain WA]